MRPKEVDSAIKSAGEAIRKVAKRNNLPVDTITQVSVLDPYFYK